MNLTHWPFKDTKHFTFYEGCWDIWTFELQYVTSLRNKCHKWDSNLMLMHATWKLNGLLHAAMRNTVVRLSSLTFISHLTALFSCPWQPHTSEALYMRWSHRMIYRLAVWAKAVCMLGSPGEFTTACTTLSARGDTVAFQADEAMSSDSQRAFCSIQLLQNLLFTEMSRQSRTQVQLVFLKGKTVVIRKEWMLTLLCKLV